MSHTAPPTGPPGGRSLLEVGLTVVIGIAFAGYLVGTRAAPTPALTPVTPFALAEAVVDAPDRALTWGELGSVRRGPNQGPSSDLAALAIPRSDRTPAPPGPEERLAALSSRAERRAYDGAPPTVPHAIDQVRAGYCLSCHAEGMRLGDRVARRISHPPYAQCTQCHVASEGPLRAAGIAPPSTFAGLRGHAGGERAWPGAPPTIPHTTLMREDCASCHGPAGPVGLRTSHPERGSCTQCHAPSAVLDQRGG